nr:bacterial transcriptional activator domain-containing protein [Caenimonas aquaedulcis]
MSRLADCVSLGLKNIATAVLTRLGAGLLALYRGGICGAEQIGWLTAVQRKLSIQFISTASALGQELESRKCWIEADRLWQRVLDAEPLCESAHRGLMRSAHAQGDWAAAWSHYRFCRDTLSVILSQPPCPQTHRLARELGLLGESSGHTAA